MGKGFWAENLISQKGLEAQGEKQVDCLKISNFIQARIYNMIEEAGNHGMGKG